MVKRKLSTSLIALLLCMTIPQLAWASNDSLDDSTRQSSRDSTNNNSNNSDTGPLEITLTGVVVLTGIAFYAGGTYTAYRITDSTHDKDEERAARELSRYLQVNHGAVTRDVLAGRGLFWDTWRMESQLSQAELTRFEAYFNGSSEQTAMLHTLNSELSPDQAKHFASNMMQAARTALGHERFDAVVQDTLKRYQTMRQGS